MNYEVNLAPKLTGSHIYPHKTEKEEGETCDTSIKSVFPLQYIIE